MKQLKQSQNDLFANVSTWPALKGLPGRALPICRVEALHRLRPTIMSRSMATTTPSMPFRAFCARPLRRASTDGSPLRSSTRAKADCEPHALARRVYKPPRRSRSTCRRAPSWRYAEWSPARMLREAEKIGPATIALFEAIMKAKPHPEQGLPLVPSGILSLVKSYGPERIEACGQARQRYRRATTYGSIKSILQNGLDRAFAKPSTPDASPDPARQHHAGPWLLPLSNSRMIACPGRPASGGTRRKGAGRKDKGRNDTCFHIPHTTGYDRPRPHRHGQSVRGAATAAPAVASRSRSRSGSACSSTARPSSAKASGSSRENLKFANLRQNATTRGSSTRS